MRKALGIICSLVTVLGMAAVMLRAAPASADTTPPTEPGTITVSSVTATSVYLAWGGSKDTLGIEGYRVYRQLSGGPEELIATTDALRYYTAVNLRSAANYTFGVTAIDVNNSESAMQTTMATTLASTDVSIPSPPSNASLAIKPFSANRLDVVWGNSPSSNVAYFEVYRNGVMVATVDLPNAPHYSDNGLAASTTYNYAIDAVSSNGVRSALTTTKSGKTLATGAVTIPRGPVVSNVTASAAVISWWTNIPTNGVLSIGGQTLPDSAGDVQRHQVSVSGLAAAATTSYSVSGTDPTTSQSAIATGSVTTAAAPGTTFSFAAMGDYGGGGPGEVDNAANIGTAGTQFIQTLGDNIYPSAGLPDPNFTTTYSDFDTHFYKELGPDVNTQAFFPANGNKDYYSNGQFWVNFPMLGTNHEWYSYNWGDAHILVLDSEQPMGPGSTQYAFAQADLAANQGEKWRIVAVQRPPYSSTTANSSSKFAQALIPLFQGYRVNLVLSGNSHNYERSYPLLNGVQDHTNGITYIVSGGGGSGFDKFNDATYPEPIWSAYRESNFWEFAKITVSPTSIQENAVEADTDTVFDSTIISPFPADTTAPAAPTGLTDAGATTSSVALNWTPNAVGDGVTGYVIDRNGKKVGSTSGITTSFTDTTASAGTTYQYTVGAVDGAGNVSAQSVVVSVTTTGTTSQPTLVQTAGSSTTTVNLATPNASGDLLVLSASVFTGASQEISSVTDSAGNIWQRAGAYTVHGVNADGELWYAAGAHPVSSVTVSTGATTVALQLQDFSGVAATNPLEVAAGSADTGTAASSGAATPTQVGDLAVGYIAGHSSTQPITVSSPGYHVQPLELASSPSKATVETGYQVLASTAPVGFAGSFGAAMYWSSGVALFKASSTVRPPPPNDFAVAASPESASITAGASTTSTVTTAVTSGVAQSVSLTATGVPTGALVSFAPQVITAGQRSTMTVTTSTGTPAATSSITVTGMGASATHSTSFSLTVVAPVATTPQLVETASGTATAATTALAGSFPTPTRPGDLLVLAVSENTGATNHITSVTDSGGNSWSRIGDYNTAGHSSDGELWYSANAASASTVIVHTATATAGAFEVEEFSGVATTTPLDAAAGSSATGLSAGSGTVSSGQSGELAVGFIAGHANKQAISLTSSGYSVVPQQISLGASASTIASVVTGYRVLGAAGVQSTTGSFGTAMYWAAGIALFKPAG